MKAQVRVLVTDGEQRAALAVVRSLGRAGYHVSVCAPRRASLAAASQYCRRGVAVGDPLSEPHAFVERVLRAADETRADVLIPVTEAALAALLPQRHRLRAILPFACAESFDRICDKAEVLAAAANAGIATPAQQVITSAAGLAEIAGHPLRFPLVLKPSRSVVTVGIRRTKTTVVHAADAAALLRAAGTLPDAAYPLLLQERVVGPGIGIFLLLYGGEVVASFAHRRLREKPPSGGVSVYRESCALDEVLLDRSVALLRHFDWEGVAMVEYKLDERTGTPYLMEINGRFWGSLQLPIDAGVDFPALLVERALGRDTGPAPSYSEGVRCRWLMGDVDHLLARLRKSPAELGLATGAPGRVRAVVDFISAFGPGSRGEVFRLTDPMPAVVELAQWARGR